MKTLRLIGMALFAVFSSLYFASCSSDEEVVTQIEIKEGTNISVKIGESQTLHALHYPEHLMAPEYSWVSENSSIVSVDEISGKIIANSIGETTITVRAYGTLSASCRVKVLPIEAESLTLNYKEYTLEIEESFELKATILPANATDKTIVWKSSDETIVKLSKKSNDEVVVEALSDGQCKVIATLNSGECVAECNVTVNKISVKGIEVEDDVKLMIGDEYQIIYSIMPENAANKKVIWSCEDSSIATVSELGVVKGIKLGTTKLMVKTEDGNYSAECYVTVTDIVGMLQGYASSGVIINGYWQKGDFRCSLTNNSNKDIRIKSLQLIDTKTMIGSNIIDIPDTPILGAGQTATYYVSVYQDIYRPIFRWIIIYENEEYVFDYYESW